MKRITLILVFFSFLFSESFAQNGTSVVPMPGFFSPYVLRYKNCLAEDANGKIWIGLRDNGIITWDGTAWDYFDMNNGLSDYNVHCIDFDPNGDAWAGTDTGGVCRYNGSGWTVYANWNSPLPSNKILCTLRQGTLRWFGTNRGLVSFDGTNWTVYNAQNSSLPGDTVNALATAQSGELLVATSRGLIRYDGSNWSGLVQGTIDYVYVHSDGTEWVSNGGSLMKNTGSAFVPLGQLMSLPWATFNTGVKEIGKGPSGGVCFCTVRGTITELESDRMNIYYPYGLVASNFFSYGLFLHAAVSNDFWFVNSYTSTQAVPFNALLRFDPAGYNGFGKITFDNSKDIDINQVHARLLNRGDMHWDLSEARYDVPWNGGASTIFCSALWIGALDPGDTLHEAAMNYRQTGMDFYPGPVDPQTVQCDSAQAWKFDRTWKVDQYHISEFQWQFAQGNVQNGTYTVPSDIRDWPAIGNFGVTEPLAPFVDVNANGIYDPLTGGDYPQIKGDEELFCVFNDVTGPHGQTSALPLGVEIQLHAYAYTCPVYTDSTDAVNYLTLYSYDIINRSSVNYHRALIGFFSDVDLGNWQDDFVGSIPSANAVFAYNGDANDEIVGGVPAYGNYPPLQSFVVLDAPPAVANDSIDNDNDGTIDEPGEKGMLNAFTNFSFITPQDSPTSLPVQGIDYYNYMNAKWRDGSPFTYGGNGYGGTNPTRFLYPSLPDDTSGWSEGTAGNTPYDRSLLLSAGPFDLAAGDTAHFEIGLITTFDSVNAWNSHAYYQRMLSDIGKVQNWHANHSFPSCMAPYDVSVNELPEEKPQLHLFPNPVSDQLAIVYAPQTKDAFIEIFDTNGKLVFSGKWKQETMYFSASQMNAGLYFVRIVDGKNTVTGKFLKN